MPPAGTLGELTRQAFERARALNLSMIPSGFPEVSSLEEALRASTVGVIAEVKRRSPSKGVINPGLDTGAQVAAYAQGGAAAISILTEPFRFGGSIADIGKARAVSGLPVLSKDFHVSAAQLREARAAGASAALLIVRALPPDQIAALSAEAGNIGLEILFEVRNESELETAVEAGARMIGVNNRNLETLEIEPRTAERIIPLIPPGLVAVAESGYSDRASVEQAALAGADAVLAGSHLSASSDPAGCVAALTNIRKHSRGRFP